MARLRAAAEASALTLDASRDAWVDAVCIGRRATCGAGPDRPTIASATTERDIGTLCVIHWDAEIEQVLCDPLLPPFRSLPPASGATRPFPPRLNLGPAAFLTALVEHVLFAGLHALLFGSLIAEHQQRVRHLEGALQRVDSRAEELGQLRNLLRQEEITEEIELILLNLPKPELPTS